MTPFDESTWTTTHQQFVAPATSRGGAADWLARQSGLGIAALGFGIATWAFILAYTASGAWINGWLLGALSAFAAIITGSLGISRRVVGYSAGRALAIVGLVLGAVPVLAWLAGVIFFIVLFAAGGLEIG